MNWAGHLAYKLPHMCSAIAERHHILATRWSGCRSLVHAVPDEMPEMVTKATCTFAFGASRSSATSPYISCGIWPFSLSADLVLPLQPSYAEPERSGSGRESLPGILLRVHSAHPPYLEGQSRSPIRAHTPAYCALGEEEALQGVQKCGQAGWIEAASLIQQSLRCLMIARRAIQSVIECRALQPQFQP